jgi:hypothetical protein
VSVLGYRDPGTNPFAYVATNNGLNSSETVLTPSNVNRGAFGKLATVPLDGQVYAQVLIKTGVEISASAQPGIHTVAFVATENDSVYAIDASSGVVLWHTSFINPTAGITAMPSVDLHANLVYPEISITSTPVIDPYNDVLYVMAETKNVRSDGMHAVWALHALNISNGSEALGGPVVVADTVYTSVNGKFTFVSGPSVPGDGAGSVNGVVPFNAFSQNQRPALTLADGDVFAMFASNADLGQYHGWVLGFSAANLHLTAVFNDTPNGEQGGIWEDGDGLVVDSQGDLYFTTGNGTFDMSLNSSGFPSLGDYGDSVVKLAIDPRSSPSHPNQNGWGVRVVDYFTPYNQQILNVNDYDLDSGGVTLLPASLGSSAHRNLLIFAGKKGEIYLVDADNMGKFYPAGNRIVAQISGGNHGIFSSPAVFGTTLYYGGVLGRLTPYKITNAKFKPDSAATTPNRFLYPGVTPTVSANGGKNAIVWVLDKGTNTLKAFSAANLHKLLYSSAEAPGNRDALGQVVKFTVPTIANGKVYVGTYNSLDIYGPLPRSKPQARAHGRR